MISLLKNSWIKWTILTLLLTLMVGCSKATSPLNNSTDNTSNQNEIPKSSTNKPTTTDNSSTATPVLNDSHKEILSNILKLAKEGKVINCEFPVNTTVIEDIEKKWGKPNKIDWVPTAKGNYATYSKENAVFGFNKGSQIYEVRSLDKDLSKISMSMIKGFFGVPAHDVKTNGQEIIGYIASPDYKILFVFPQASVSGTSQLLDHYSVLYPKGTVNSMADDAGREW